MVLGADANTGLIVSARTSGSQRDEFGISLFLVPAGAVGLIVDVKPTIDGLSAVE